MNRLHGIILATMLCLAQPLPAGALEVRDVLWGFDGHWLYGRFTPVWVLIANPSDDMFTGDFTFRNQLFSDESVPLEVHGIAISPGAQRWVEFVPYIEMGGEHWVISWNGTEKGGVALNPLPKTALPARVLLDDPEVLNPPAGIKTFPEDRFPVSVTELDALGSVVLDHVPRWQPLQRQALLDWLFAGGIIHLVKDGNDRFPEFTDELAILNTPEDQFHVGAGLIVRHDLPRLALTDDALLRAGFPSPPNIDQMGHGYMPVDQGLVMGLRSLVHLQHNWTLIYTFSIVYLLLIGPINWLMGRRFRDFRLPLLFLVVCMATFTWLFFVIGRRGNGETALTYSLSEARPTTGDEYDVTQWSSIFVTSGGMYDLTHDAPHNLYAVTGETEEIYGKILNGKDGRFLVNIPLYSAQFHPSRAMPGPPAFTAKFQDLSRLDDAIPLRKKPAPQISFQSPAPQKTMSPFAIIVGPTFPKATLGVWIERDGQWYEMNIQSDSRLLPGDPVAVDGYQYKGWAPYTPDANPNDSAPNEAWLNSAMVHMAQTVIVHHVTGYTLNPAAHPSALKQLHLYVLERAPASFNLVSNNLGREIGYVLIDQVVALPEDRTP